MKKAKQGQTSILSNKRGCPRRKNVGLNRVSVVPLNWSMNNTCAIKPFLKGTRALVYQGRV